MIDRQKHYFRENDCTVITGWIPQIAEFGATREDEDEGLIRGYGATRLEAIADLVWAISNGEEEEGRNAADFHADHILDYRKHEAM